MHKGIGPTERVAQPRGLSWRTQCTEGSPKSVNLLRPRADHAQHLIPVKQIDLSSKALLTRNVIRVEHRDVFSPGAVERPLQRWCTADVPVEDVTIKSIRRAEDK